METKTKGGMAAVWACVHRGRVCVKHEQYGSSEFYCPTCGSLGLEKGSRVDCWAYEWCKSLWAFVEPRTPEGGEDSLWIHPVSHGAPPEGYGERHEREKFPRRVRW